MLPTPASLYSRNHRSRYHHQRPLRDVLLTRARITNLGFLLLLGFAVLSCLLNLYYWLFAEQQPRHPPLDFLSPHSILATIERDKALGALEHLVVVPGHAIWTGSKPEDSYVEDEWLMESFQQGDKAARIQAYHQHISRGIDIAEKDESALLVFSGGHTKRITAHTEASSYHNLALVNNLLPPSFPRVTTEEAALDSYENLLFSIARFHEFSGRYPTRITVIGYEMKRRRFEQLHRASVRWPSEEFRYIGIDPEGQDIERAREGEKTNGYVPYSQDNYGCHDVLLSKRRSRNPQIRFHSYFTSAPELSALFNWCPSPADGGGSTAAFRGPLPWDRHVHSTSNVKGSTIGIGRDSS
ncbi:hypothetical protein BC835DRAFT_1277460 [Cytidiella melzeri]|nr:hypothetical protein BC835DRAFT_1277460 [Cytidiella melzeri]